MISSGADVADWLEALADGEELMLEERVSFTRELAQLIARRPSGQTALWPVVETIQQDGVCAEVIAPAPGSAGAVSDMAAKIAVSIAEGLDVTGVLAVELFETDDERILVNELAMRPHNSGHWTIDGSTTSQFEQHLRAVLDLPLGATNMTAKFAVMVNVLGGPSEGMTSRLATAMGNHPHAKIHAYGKEFRAGRKVGHVTVAGDDLDAVVAEARGAAVEDVASPGQAGEPRVQRPGGRRTPRSSAGRECEQHDRHGGNPGPRTNIYLDELHQAQGIEREHNPEHAVVDQSRLKQ
jgi:5-(carboxyamino)imidazole ribonucleotide synthase